VVVTTKTPAECGIKVGGVADVAQLFNFQWLARPAAGSILLRSTHGSRCRLFIDQVFFERS